MASTSYMPSTKVDQVAWAARFVETVSPNATDYGLTTALMASFTALNATLQSAWVASQNEATRTKVTINQRDQALSQMKKLATGLVSIIQGTPAVTSDMLIAAGLTVRSSKPVPNPVPTTSPFMVVQSVDGRTVTVELRQAKAKRGRPSKVASASVFTAPVGAAMDDTTAWSFYTNTTKTTVDITFPPSSTGDAVYITAFWSNSRSESGPSAMPISVNLPASVPAPVMQRMKAAA